MGLLGCMRWDGARGKAGREREQSCALVGPAAWEAEPCTILGVYVYTIVLYSSRDISLPPHHSLPTYLAKGKGRRGNQPQPLRFPHPTTHDHDLLFGKHGVALVAREDRDSVHQPSFRRPPRLQRRRGAPPFYSGGGGSVGLRQRVRAANQDGRHREDGLFPSLLPF
jgi:hypothetical protein